MNKRVSKVIQVILDNLIELDLFHYDYVQEKFIYRKLNEDEEEHDLIVPFRWVRIDYEKSSRDEIILTVEIKGDNDAIIYLDGSQTFENELGNFRRQVSDEIIERNTIHIPNGFDLEPICEEVLRKVLSFNEMVING